MRTTIATVCILILAVPCLASNLGNQVPPKPPSIAMPSEPDPSRQGGDTYAQAFPIPALPYFDTGTTTGYANDYDEWCPIDGFAPDVVYVYRPVVAEAISVDLCGSSYDTKIEIYDDAFIFVACNDDYYFDDPCGEYRSKIEHVDLEANRSYYIVVDGYASAHGDYILAVDVHVPCDLACPAGSMAEGEPPLHDGYVDVWNGGCSTGAFQPIGGDGQGEAVLCGVGGWYQVDGFNARDTDWYTLVMGPSGTIGVVADAEIWTYFFELLPQDCAAVAPAQLAMAQCAPVTLTITGYDPGAMVWFWAGPRTFEAPGWTGDQYDYVVWFSGLEAGVAAAPTTWSTVKALYE